MFINDSPLELPDLIPEIFDLKLQVSINAIRDIVSRHHYNNIEQISTLKPIQTVRLGHLGVPESEEFILSKTGLKLFDSLKTDDDTLVLLDQEEDLRLEYKLFWRAMIKHRLPPVIESNITGLSPAVNGTWLSVKVHKIKR
jgi:hypothetical protein